MSIHDRKLRSLTVSRVFTTPYIASPEPTRGIQKFISHLKEPFISSSNREEFLLVLTCDHVAVLRGGNGDAGDLGTRSSSRGSGPLTLTSADSSPTSSLTDNSFDASSSQSLVLSVALSHLTQVTADGSSVTLEFVCSSGHKAATTDPFSPSPAFPVLSAIGDRAKSIVGESNKAGRSGHHMGKQVSTLRSVLPLQQVVLYAESEQDAVDLAEAVQAAMQRIIDALLWLDRGMPLNQDLSMCVVSLDSSHHADQGAGSGADAVVARSPAWGSTVTLPPITQPLRDPSTMGPSPALMLDLATPLGPCHIRVPIADVITAVNTEAGHLTVRAAVKESAAHSDTPFCVEVSCAAACTWAEAEAPVEEPPRQLPVVAQRPSLYKGPGLVIGSALFWVAVLLHVVGPFATSVLVAIDAAIVGAIAYRYMAIRKSITRASAGTTTVRRPSKAKKRHVATVHVKFVRAELIEEPPLGTDDQDEEPLVAAIPEESAVAPVERTASLQQAPTIRRMPSLIKQGSARVVDFGIVSLRRVVTITSAAVEITSIDALIANAAAGGDLEDEEAATLRVLAAKSPVATPNLFRRYVAACGGDRVQALQRLRITVEWRQAHNIDAVLSSPIPAFFSVKDAYVHAVVGRTRDGMPVIVEGMGGFKHTMSKLRAQGVTPKQMLHQFVFVMEYITQRLDPTPWPAGKFVRIYDFKGISFGDISDSEAVGLGKQMMDMLEQYYPERMAKAFVVNIPGFFSILWKMVRPMLDPRTAEKITVVSGKKGALNALRTVMDDEVIPKEYGGNGVGSWYEGPEEKAIAALATKLNSVPAVGRGVSVSAQ